MLCSEVYQIWKLFCRFFYFRSYQEHSVAQQHFSVIFCKHTYFKIALPFFSLLRKHMGEMFWPGKFGNVISNNNFKFSKKFPGKIIIFEPFHKLLPENLILSSFLNCKFCVTMLFSCQFCEFSILQDNASQFFSSFEIVAFFLSPTKWVKRAAISNTESFLRSSSCYCLYFDSK